MPKDLNAQKVKKELAQAYNKKVLNCDDDQCYKKYMSKH